MSNDNNTTTTTTAAATGNSSRVGVIRPSPPPQLIFDDGSRIMTEEASEEEEKPQRQQVRGSIPIEIYYEIDRIVNEIPLLLLKDRKEDNKDSNGSDDDSKSKANKSQSQFLLRIAVQFPDELLDDSYEVCWLLEERLLKTFQQNDDVLVFVLGDTTVGSCCPDEVAALHLQADILIHYGHACLSPTGSLPVIYSFGQLEFNTTDQQVLIEQIKDKLKGEQEDKKKKKKLLLLYHVGYHHVIESIQKQIIQDNDVILDYLDEVIAGQLPKPTLVGKQKVMLPSSTSTTCCGGGGGDGGDGDKTTMANTSTTTAGGCCSSPSTSCCMNDPNTAAVAVGGSTNDNTTTTITSSLSKQSDDQQQQQQQQNQQQKKEKVTTSPPPTTLIVGGLELPITEEDSNSNTIQSWDDDFTNFIVLYIGNPESTTQRRQYINIMLRLLSLSKPPSDFWTYSPSAPTATTTASNKIVTSIPNTLKVQLKRRFFLTQKARDANIYGIVVSNLSQQNLIDVVKTIERKIKNKGKSSYNFAVGKINPAKLANFAEIDCFVLVACREQALLDNERDYHVPVITPLELDIALGYCDWGQQSYSLDCLDIMQMAQNNKDDGGGVGGGGDINDDNKDGNDSNDDDDDDAPYFSMVTGKYVHNPSSSSKKSPDLDLANLPGQGQVMEYNSEAANFLKQREYQGLQSDIGQTEVTAAIPGQQGIASNYNGS